MSVNIFGSSGSRSSSGSSVADKKYIDQKFATHLATKVNKYGDSISGNLDILLEGDNLRTFGVRDSAPGKSVVFLLGYFDTRIQNNFDNALQIVGSHEIKFTGHAGDICWLGGKAAPQALFYTSINMNGNHIGGLNDPNWEQDAATKKLRR